MPKLIQLEPFQVAPLAFYELILLPEFGDTIDTTGMPQPSDEEGDWMIMDDVVAKRPIIEVYGGNNVLKRRDQTCKIIYSPIGRLGNRFIYTEEVYAATEDCQREFYQGCFKDFQRKNFQVIYEKMMPILEKAVSVDVYTNKYFGDVSRAADPNGIWSWNKFDGIFTQFAKYIAQGLIPASQTFSIPGGVIAPIDAFNVLSQAYESQPDIMETLDPQDKAFYVDIQLANAYWDYLILTGSCNQNSLSDRQKATPTMFFRGIELRVKRWNGVLAALNGNVAAHVCLLTIRGNFIFATDKNYGGGPNEDEAVRAWYSMDDDVWRKQIHLRAGTEWGAPTFVVLGMTNIV